MLLRPIPSSGEQIPVVGLGSWLQFDVTGKEKEPLKNVLRTLAETGGKVIDSSPMYGKSEEVLGELTAETGLSDKFFYATKVWTSGKQGGIRQMEESLRKMRRKTMDLMQIHNLLDWETHLGTLRQWKKEGKIRYIGITHYVDSAHPALEKIVRSEKIDFLQVNLSITGRNAEKTLLPAAMENNVAVIINQPFGQGALFSKVRGKPLPGWAGDYGIRSWAQFFLKYILSNPAVTCVIPGTSVRKNMLDNAGAGKEPLPDEETRAKMAALADEGHL
ncbi:MAG TPA: aldo/keto reductase [Candidatus Bilamarchaeum sp.]|nr:aldo/keto reductase [Candidatus Bilamarchaeum sp.]